MKYDNQKYFFLTFVCLVTFLSVKNYYSQNLKPILKFNFNNNINDFSDNKFQVIPNGDIKYRKDRHGNNCSSIYFDGHTYLEITNNKVLENLNKFTISCWFKVDSSDNYWLSLFCKGDKSLENFNNPQIRAQIFQGKNQSTISINSIFTEKNINFQRNLIKPNAWSFVTITYDGNEIKSFINGNLTFSSIYGEGIFKNKSNFFIGLDIPGNKEFHKGYLDDFSLYDFAIKEHEIKILYKKLNTEKNTDKKKCNEKIEVFSQIDKCGNFVNFQEPISSCFVYKSNIIKGLESNSFFNVGVTKNIIKYDSDEESFVCSFDIEVLDKVSPYIKCPNDTLIESEKLTNIYCLLPKTSDNCKVKEVKNKTFKSNLIDTFGKHNIVFEVKDIYGNTNSCNYNIKYNKIKNLYSEDEVNYSNELNFKNNKITLSIYDNALEDNDTISIIYNNEEIVKKKMVKLKINGPIVLVLDLNTREQNSFIFKAWNVGRISPNTIKIDFYNGDISNRRRKINKIKPEKSLVLNSKPGNSTALWLKNEIR
mgnify:CR=1 FL=1